MACRALTAALVAGAALPASGLRSRSSYSAAEVGAIGRSKTENLLSYTFKQFVQDFQRQYQEGSEEWASREELFNQTITEMAQHNAADEHSWKMGISRFLDYTPAEKKKLLGYTGRGSRKAASASSGAFELRRSRVDLPQLFKVTQGKKGKLMNLVRDQGNCGSCWAEAATSTLEGQLEANEPLMQELERAATFDRKVPATPTLSSQAVVSCTKNKRHCGGTGGCGGATVELAYGMLQERGGLPFAAEWSYAGYDEECQASVFNNHKIGITHFNILPSNKLSPLMEALVSSGGPVAISVDATNWFSYSSGVYSDVRGDFTVNHAVTLMGYKAPEYSSGWWLIKNSWGSYWGESGHIRIEFKPNEEQHCGWDYNTHEGLACDGDPDKAWVCGTCGMLYDSVIPRGLHLVK